VQEIVRRVPGWDGACRPRAVGRLYLRFGRVGASGAELPNIFANLE
jgi:hypothetical protein